jgi:hypothetical protein
MICIDVFLKTENCEGELFHILANTALLRLTSALRSGLGSASHKVNELGMSIE